ncbi:MAG: tail fiber domain-containing protein [Rhizobacter sp.]|nr:tail fiber domain-containing protein [Ferruginibacter sp.]
MNRLRFTALLALLITTNVFAQNVGIGTTQFPAARLLVKNTENQSALTLETPNEVMGSVPMFNFVRGNSRIFGLDADFWGNMFVGSGSGENSNSASGSAANVFVGPQAGKTNVSGRDNTAVGFYTFQFNNSGSYNTSIGSLALRYTTASQFNTAVGYKAGNAWNNGYNNVFIGANTDVNNDGCYNVIAMGQGTIVTTSSTARFGNSATTSYGGWASWTNLSDGRFKEDIQENVPGLAFIARLKPVTYHIAATKLDDYLHRNKQQELTPEAQALYTKALYEKEAILYSGFIAQDVEAAAKSLGFDFSGVDKPKTTNDTYGLRYAEFVVPLVKAVQEQQEQIEVLKKQVAELKAMIMAGK